MQPHPTRRAALASGLALAGSAVLGRAGAREATRRPNILLILADDWSWQGAEAVDRLHLEMPNFARIQRDGINFTNAFVASPSCTASRGALLAGRWPWRLGEGANLVSVLPKNIPLYTDHLEQSGYHVGYARKGWGPGKWAPVGRTRNPAGTEYADFDAFLSQRPPAAPHCFWFGTHDPHRPYVRGEGVRSGIDLATISVPPYLPDNETVRSDIADYRFDLERLDREAGQLLDRLARDGELEHTLVVMTGDNGWPFPRGKATLYDAGWHVPMAMMWPAQVTGGRVSDAMVSLIDLAATFLQAAGAAPLPHTDSRSLMPLLQGGSAGPRRFVMGGLERHMDGRAVQGQGYPTRALRTASHLYIRNLRPERWPAGDPNRRPVAEQAIEDDVYAAFADIDAGPTKAYMATHRDDAAVAPLAELAMGKRPARELYDVAADPYSLRNLAADPAHRGELMQLDRQLMKTLRQTHDPRVVGGGDAFDHYPVHSDPGFERPKDF